VIDPEHGWDTDRLTLEPLTGRHAAELAPLLDDPALHEFIGGVPLTAAELAERYARLRARRSADGSQVWCNWVLRVRESGAAIGTLQATLPASGPPGGPAAVAWVVARVGQRRGYAREAATSLVDRLRQAGWTVEAYIHPGHLASQRVAQAAGLCATGHVVDGEIRWVSPRPGGD